MSLWNRIKALLRREPGGRDRLPEVLGYVTDDRGERHEVRRGWIKHDSLSPDQLRRIARLRDALAEAYPMTLDGWVDGFLRDADPESEIQIIEACASVYQRLVSSASLSPPEKGRLYGVLCVLSAGGGPELASSLPAGRGLPEIEEIARMYREARQEGSRP